LLYKLCYYTTPFEEQGPLAILSAKFSFPSYPHFTDQTKNLITWLLSEDQDRRPNIYQVVEAVCKLRGKECPIRNVCHPEIVVHALFAGTYDNARRSIPMSLRHHHLSLIQSILSKLRTIDVNLILYSSKEYNRSSRLLI
jgi:hypothetical protein